MKTTIASLIGIETSCLLNRPSTLAERFFVRGLTQNDKNDGQENESSEELKIRKKWVNQNSKKYKNFIEKTWHASLGSRTLKMLDHFACSRRKNSVTIRHIREYLVWSGTWDLCQITSSYSLS